MALAARYAPVTNHAVLILAALSPYLMACAGLSALLLLLGRRWWTASAALALTAVAVVVELPMFIGSVAAPANSAVIRVLTANLREGSANSRSLVAIARARADLLVLEELTPHLADSLIRDGLDQEFPYRVLDARPYAAGMAIWSRYPVLRSARIADYQLGAITAAIRPLDGANEAIVLAAHLAGPWPQSIDDWRRDIDEFPDTMNEVAASAGSGAVIVAGDFNASIDIRPFRQLSRNGYRDAAEQSGAGLTPSYPADAAMPPFIAIDHVLTLNSSASDAKTVRIPGSDHLGFCANVHVPR